MSDPPLSTLAVAFAASGWDGGEARLMSRLVELFLSRPDPPDAGHSFPDYGRLRDRLYRLRLVSRRRKPCLLIPFPDRN